MQNQKRSQITSSRIKEAAAHLFAEQGYDAAGVAEICSAAGVSKGAFYHHFKSKSQLFISLLEDWLDELDRMLGPIAAEDTDFPTRLTKMGDMIALISDEYRTQIPILFEFWMQAARDEDVWQAAVAPLQRYQTYFSSLIEEGIEKGHLEPVDAQAAARTLVSLAIGLLLQYMLVIRMGRKPGTAAGAQTRPAAGSDWNHSIQQSIQILINGLTRCT